MADAGNNFSRARVISPRAGFQTIRETLSRTDRDDYYRFNVSSNTRLDASVLGILARSNFDFYLYNQQRRLVRSSRNPSNRREDIRINLTAGRWFLRVQWRPGSLPNARPYRLRFAATPLAPVDNAGNTLATARNLGNVSSGTYSDYVGSQDYIDYYKFTVTQNSSFRADLTPFSPTANVNLANANGGFIAGTNQTGTGVRSIQQTLLPGTYYAAVFAGGAASNYSFQITNTPIPDNAGNDFGTAASLNVGVQPSTVSDFVGGSDSRDIYQFTTTTGGNLDLNLTGTTANLRINLYDSGTNYLNTGVQNYSVSGLAAGTYYVEIISDTAGSGSAYTLTSQIVPPDNVGNDFANAKLITGTVGEADPFPVLDGTPRDYSDYAGGSDVDIFKLDFTGQTYNFLSVNLGGFTAASNLNLRLWKVENGTEVLKITSNRPGATAEVFEGTLGSGVYYLEVYSGVSSGALSPYDLTMSVSTSANGRPSITRDVYPGGDSNASILRQVGSNLFFTASDGENLNLWRTGGSLDTTISVGTFESITNMVAVGNTLYIVGERDANTGVELYAWNADVNNPDLGTISLVADITAGEVGTSFESLTAVEDPNSTSYLYFRAASEENPTDLKLYRTDGQGVTEITGTGSGVSQLTAVGNTLYYTARGILNGASAGDPTLWRVNGTTGQEVTQFTESGNPVTLRAVGALKAVGDNLYFIASEYADPDYNNQELRQLSGGNAIQTFDANNDPNTGTFEPDSQSFAIVGNYLYFTAKATPQLGTELFRADLTTGTTEALPEFRTDTGAGSNPANLTVYQNQLFFTATDDTGDTELYVISNPDSASLPTYDPNNPGASTIAKLDLLNTGSSNPRDFRLAAGNLYFVATREVEGTEVYTYNGSGSATDLSSYTVAFDIALGATNSDPQELVVVGDTAGDGSTGRLYFTANDGLSGREVWVI